MHACGSVIRKELKREAWRVDSGCQVGVTPGIEYDIEALRLQILSRGRYTD